LKSPRDLEIRSQKCNGGGVFTWRTGELLKQFCLRMAGGESNILSRVRIDSNCGAGNPVRGPAFSRLDPLESGSAA